MTRHDPLLDLDSDELGRLLVERARREKAPAAARQRALARVSGMVAGGATLSVAGAQTVGVATKSMPWLIAKSLFVGMGASALLLTAAQQLQPHHRAKTPDSAAALPGARGSHPMPLSVIPPARTSSNAASDPSPPSTAKSH